MASWSCSGHTGGGWADSSGTADSSALVPKLSNRTELNSVEKVLVVFSWYIVLVVLNLYTSGAKNSGGCTSVGEAQQ
ncbi:hypothetical protein FH972_014361 [Carpinus fangiana]|uniref:Uncharacterized protein n=1 Tax=Carpinus fangiana TaxID=176857 RepID=A0A5N6RCR3_9ROSI|nr:hypothetical protein FH972_014361 [Carpinus fangiana]